MLSFLLSEKKNQMNDNTKMNKRILIAN